MALSKRLRYEILRRDNHACRYCGATAPDVKLTIDHVVPVALGGTDEASNLVTACADCNGGKTSSSPDGPIVGDVAEDALRWRDAMQEAARAQQRKEAKLRFELETFDDAWEEWFLGNCYLWIDEGGWHRTKEPLDTRSFPPIVLRYPFLKACILQL